MDSIYIVVNDLNLVNMFWSCNISFKLRADNVYTVGNESLQVIYVCLSIMYLRFISWPIVGKGIFLSSLYEQKNVSLINSIEPARWFSVLILSSFLD